MRTSLWEQEAIEDLRFYLPCKQALDNLIERYYFLEEQYGEGIPTYFDINDRNEESYILEDSLIDNILMRDKLKKRYERTKQKIQNIEKGLSHLNDKQRNILDAYYINPREETDPCIQESSKTEQSRLRQIKKEALYRFTVSMYGTDRE